MTTPATNATTTQTDDAKTVDPVPTTTAKDVPEKLPAASTDRKDGESGEIKSKTEDPATVTAESNSDDGASVNDTQKKMRRAERFGMPVQLSEEEKRNSRAERFGTTPSTQGSSGETKKAEELKRKARAERFGITPASTPTEEDEKKKARLSRFGSPAISDPAEEQKKKARALRFSGNGNGKVEPKAVGEA